MSDQKQSVPWRHSFTVLIGLHVRDLDACIEFYQSYCEMQVVHQRTSHDNQVVWLAEEGRENDFILLVLPGGPGRDQAEKDFSHLGFALESRKSVDAIAERAREEGILVWEPTEEPYPVGYYCAVHIMKHGIRKILSCQSS